MLHAVLPKTHETHLKYHVVTADWAEPPFTVKVINYITRQDLGREYSILHYITLTLDVYQVCHCVSQSFKNGSFTSSSLE